MDEKLEQELDQIELERVKVELELEEHGPAMAVVEAELAVLEEELGEALVEKALGQANGRVDKIESAIASKRKQIEQGERTAVALRKRKDGLSQHEQALKRKRAGLAFQPTHDRLVEVDAERAKLVEKLTKLNAEAIELRRTLGGIMQAVSGSDVAKKLPSIPAKPFDAFAAGKLAAGLIGAPPGQRFRLE